MQQSERLEYVMSTHVMYIQRSISNTQITLKVSYCPNPDNRYIRQLLPSVTPLLGLAGP